MKAIFNSHILCRTRFYIHQQLLWNDSISLLNIIGNFILDVVFLPFDFLASIQFVKNKDNK